MTPRRLAILGATGSIGRSTLDLVRRHPNRFEVEVLTAHTSAEALADAVIATGAGVAAIADPAAAPRLRERLVGHDVDILTGAEGVLEAAQRPVDLTMAAIVGAAGLAPTLAAAAHGRHLALANKEALVCSGPLLLETAARAGTRLLPVDSEHNAVFQALAGRPVSDVRRIVITASGGPFRRATLEEMHNATPEAAVAHPRWSRGAKISVDSATMMNKGLELIEAHLLFGLDAARLEALIHPESLVHGIVEFVDGSQVATLGPTDMRVPIAHTLLWPERLAMPDQALDLAGCGSLTFEAPDEQRFPALRVARDVLQAGGSAPTILNAANEVAVAAFLDRRLGFLDIVAVVEATLETCSAGRPGSLDDVLAVDREARSKATALLADIAAR